MPTNKKEGIIFGICICAIMVFFMGLLNISIHLGGFNFNSIKTNLIAFPLTFIIAFILENLVIGRINHKLLEKFVDKNDSKNSYILFNCFFIVTLMSLVMTIIGGFLGGDNAYTIFSEFFIRWPRNFCAAFFLNILVAGPISRALSRVVQNAEFKKSETKLVTVEVEDNDNDEVV